MSRANREGLKVCELKSICKALGIKGYSKYNKEGLILLINGERPTPPVRRRRVRKDLRQDNEDDEENDCPICMVHFTNKFTTSCRHSFCKNCITNWCKQHDNCPLCRKHIKNELPQPRRPPQPRIQRPQDFLRELEDPQDFLRELEQIYYSDLEIYRRLFY